MDNTMDNIENGVVQVLEDQLLAINGMEDGTETKTAAIKEFEIMNRAYLERLNAECMELDRFERRINDCEQADRDNRDKIIGHIFEGIKIAGVAALVVGSTIIGYKFEETGTQTSQTFKRVQDWVWKFTKM